MGEIAANLPSAALVAEGLHRPAGPSRPTAPASRTAPARHAGLSEPTEPGPPTGTGYPVALVGHTGLGRHAGVMRRAEAGVIPQWLRLFVVGLVLWGGAMALAVLTENVRLVPPAILLGGFLIPATFLIWAFERARLGDLDLTTVARAFVLGGGLGLLSAAQLEFYVLGSSPLHAVARGLVAELLKLAVLGWLAARAFRGSRQQGSRQHNGRSPGRASLSLRQRRTIGFTLGGAVGFGYAGFESAGLTITSLFDVGGLTLPEFAEAYLLPGILLPIGSGLWSAIVGGVLFAALGSGRTRTLTRAGLALLGAAALHVLWDATRVFAVTFTAAITGAAHPDGGWTIGRLDPTPDQIHLYTALHWMALVFVGLAGVLWITGLVRRDQLEASREQAALAAERQRWSMGTYSRSGSPT